MSTKPSDEQVAQAIWEKHGSLTRELAVKESKNKSHPWHDRIWGETEGEAAYQRRLYLAGKIISGIRVTVIKGPPIIKAPVFVRDPECSGTEPGYKPVMSIRDSKTQAVESMRLEFERLSSLIERIDGMAASYGLEELAEAMFEQIGISRLPPRAEAAE